MTGADAMVKCLQDQGIKVVFGYPGVAIAPFYNSLYNSDIKSVLVRQEQNGGHAASGYGRVTRKPSVCIATSGPGATNLITGLATAYADSIPGGNHRTGIHKTAWKGCFSGSRYYRML